MDSTVFSIATIAKLHGVSSALIHYYFGNKDDLWRATIEHGVGNMIRDLADIIDHLEDVDSVSRLKFFIRRYITLAAERSDVFRLILRESDTPGERPAMAGRRPYLSPLYTMVCGLVEAAQKDGKYQVDRAALSSGADRHRRLLSFSRQPRPAVGVARHRHSQP